MKTIKLFLAILTIIATISSCKKDAEVGPQGATGATGPTGPTGPTGNANVISSIHTVTKNEWSTYGGSGANFFYKELYVSHLTQEIYDKGAVNVYCTSFAALSPGTAHYELPFSVPLNDSIKDYDFSAYYYTNEVTIWIQDNKKAGILMDTLSFKVVTIAGQ